MFRNGERVAEEGILIHTCNILVEFNDKEIKNIT